MPRLLLLTVALTAILAAGLTLSTAADASPRYCAEDDPCFSWSTMGNHQRGIVTAWGTPIVVGPCGYRRAYDKARTRGMGRYFVRTNHVRGLHGDTWALRHGCVGNVQNW